MCVCGYTIAHLCVYTIPGALLATVPQETARQKFKKKRHEKHLLFAYRGCMLDSLSIMPQVEL